MNFAQHFRLGLYEKSMPKELTWQEKLIAAKIAGFDFLELSIDETNEKLSRLKWSSAERIELVHHMVATGIRIETMCLSGHRKYALGSTDPRLRSRGLKIMADACQLAVDLGIRIIQLAGYDTYYETSTELSRELFTEGLAKSVEMASRNGVILGLETMENPFMNTVSKAMEYVRLINSPYLHVYPDVGNLTNAALEYGTEAWEDLKTGLGHILAIHFKETVPGKFRDIPYGEGHVDFETMARICLSMGVFRYTAEFWHVDGADWMKSLRNANSFLRNKFTR